MASINRIPRAKYVIRKDIHNAATGESPVYIVYCLNRKTAKAQTGIWVLPTLWDEKGRRVSTSHPNHRNLNERLQVLRNQTDARIIEYTRTNELDINALRLLVKGESVVESGDDFRANDDFVDFALSVNKKEYLKEKIGISVFRNSECSLKLFRKFLRKELHRDTLPIRQMSVKTVEDYILWRKDERENANETINKTLTPIIKAAAAANLRGWISAEVAGAIQASYLPATKFSIGDETAHDPVRHLSEQQMKSLITLYKEVKYDRTRDYLDMFLFSFHACGLRFVDVMTLQWSNIDFESDLMRKVIVKNKKPLTIPLTNAARTILMRWKGRRGCDRFVFGLLPSDFDLDDDDALNRYRLNRNRPIQTSLHLIGHKIGLNFNLTFHVARHTFAVMSLNRPDNSLTVSAISRLLGHATTAITELVYARYIPERLKTVLGTDNFGEFSV